MNNNDIVISTKNLSKVYKLYGNPKDRLKEALHPRRKKYHKEFYALRNIDLEIKRGEVIGIVGKNGSGKSTLLKIISRVLTPTSGEVMVKGKISSLLELGSGFNPELTGMENIFFYGTILGFSEAKIRSKLDEMIEFADIGEFIHQPLKTYSSGMRARLAFSVAINVDPDILILDEVLAVGDALFRRKCYARMEQFFKGNKTVLFVSHSVSDVNQLCTRGIMIDEGEFIAEGPTARITTHYERFLFAKPADKSSIRRDLATMDFYHISNESANPKNDKNQKVESPISELLPAGIFRMGSELKEASGLKAFYLPEMISKTKVEYRNYEVDITDIQITTLNNDIVNVLLSGEKYKLVYKVTFHIDANNVSFGMMFKTEKGLLLSGASSHKAGLSINKIEKGRSLTVSWLFNCNLLKGMYYVNAGVLSLNENDRITLNRIVDGLVFKVYGSELDKYIGTVNLMQQPSINENLTDNLLY